VALTSNSKSREIYGKEVITERHRHRYEVNNNLIDKIEDAGLNLFVLPFSD
jgi:CTP synthase